MKFIVLFASLLFSATSFATGSLDNVSWEEIQQNRARYHVDAPGTFFQNSNPRALGSVYKRFITFDGAAAVCVSGDKIYGGKTQSCVKTERSGRDEERCVKYEPNTLWAPLSGYRTICTQWEGRDDNRCTKYKTIPYKIDTNVKAKVYYQPGMNDDNEEAGLLGYKTMQLPKCK